MIDLSIIVFAFEEEENVASILAELIGWLRAHEPRSQIVFVDDGSRDATTERARAALEGFPHELVRHETNRGIGAALKSGVRAARGEWITFLPADGQIEPSAVGTLRAASHGADLVLSVYDHRDDGLDRTLLSAGVRALIFAVHGVRLRSDGPYLIRRRTFAAAELPPDTFFLNFELPIRALAAGLRTETVTIACRPRRSGVSKSTGLRRITGVARDLLDLRRRRSVHAAKLWRGRA
jgi:dolichol-phosphate mannosyltransferase